MTASKLLRDSHRAEVEHTCIECSATVLIEYWDTVDCRECSGSGGTESHDMCSNCDGSGVDWNPSNEPHRMCVDACSILRHDGETYLCSSCATAASPDRTQHDALYDIGITDRNEFDFLAVNLTYAELSMWKPGAKKLQAQWSTAVFSTKATTHFNMRSEDE